MIVTCTEIPSQDNLDPITVFWQDWDPGKGAVTVICYGSAWTCSFLAMGDKTIREFVAQAGTDYLVNKLGITQWLKQTKGHAAYLTRILDVVKHSLK